MTVILGLKKYIFPGGIIPSLREIIYLIGEYNYYTLDVESLRRHYEKTLLEWSKNYAAKRDVIDTMFEERFVRMGIVLGVMCFCIPQRNLRYPSNFIYQKCR